MHFSNDKQTNPGETIPRLVENISKLVERLPKSMPSVETTLITTPITTTPIENNRQKQGICTGICALLKKARSNTKKKAEITLRSVQDVSYRTNERSSTSFQLLKLRKNLHQITDSFTRLQKFEIELAIQIQSHLHSLNAILDQLDEKTPISSTEYPFRLYEKINKEIMKLKYQIPSSPQQSWTSSSVHLHTRSGSNVRSALLDKLPNLYQSESFYRSSFFKEISDIFAGLDRTELFFLSCFAVLPEHAVVKRTLLTYWALGEGFLVSTYEEEAMPEEIVNAILEKFEERGLIEPAMKKQKQEIRSYKMDPLVRSAVIMLCQDAGLFDFDTNGNVVENRAPDNRAFLVEGVEKSSDDRSPFSRQGEQQSQNLDQEKLVTLFNINEVSLDLKLEQLAKKKDVNVVQWLSKMKRLKVLHLGRWQISAEYHVEVEKSEFLEELKSMEELRFLSLRGICRINALPSSIDMLHNLIILDLKECHNLEIIIFFCVPCERFPLGIKELFQQL